MALPTDGGNSPLWLIQPLGNHHNRSGFSCGKEALDRYLKQQASQDARRRVAAPFVLVSNSDRKSILGYYTLSASSMNLRDLPPETAKKLPSYPLVPVTLLGRLAVNKPCQGQGAGEFLLVDALKKSYAQSSIIGAVAVVVDAIDEQAAKFYLHFGFQPFVDNQNRLFLPMKTISILFP